MPGVTQSPPPSPSAGFNASTISSHTSRVSKHSKKYGTVVGLGHAVDGDHSNRSGASSAKAKGPHPTVMGLFEDGNGATAGGQGGPASKTDGPSASHAATAASGSKLNGPMGREDGPWSISVAEAQDKKDGSKKKQRVVSYTLYVTTPTHNLTLTRTATEIIELDQKLREGQSSANTLPALPALPVTSTQTSRRILQTISRTLSPGGNKNRVALSNLTASGLGLAPAEPISPTSSTPSTPAKPHSPASASEVSENGKINAKGNKSPHSITTHLATYLTTLSNLPFIKRHKAWKRFVRVGSDDLQSVRVERRVRKVRSDLAQHVKSSVAPTNTNVLATPSQSDIGEDSARTDDEKEDQSRSARSLSPSQASSGGAKSPSSVRDRVAGRSGIERPELPARSTSVDPERAAESDAIRKRDDLPGAVARKSRSVVSIPEEREKQTRSTPVSSNKSDGKSRESKRKDGERREKKEKSDKVTVDDFDMIRVLGKGCAGKVLLVRHTPSKGLFAMKSIHKRHVLAHQELQHTLTEQAVLKRMAREVMDPFVVKLWWSFHDKNNLYLVMDFHPGGDLATQLSRWGRLGRDRARFYAAEIVEGVEGLHKAGVIYRDLKPENVLIGSDGHIVLSDFGLSKEFPSRGNPEIGSSGSSTPPPSSPGRSQSSKELATAARSSHWLAASEDGSSSGSRNGANRWADERDVTTTFCGTAEYLAPEVIQGSAYSYEVDWWSFGTMLYEMLTGITPFWADTHADMYVRVLHDELVFPEDRVLDQDTKSILRGLLQRNPVLRMKEPRIKKHPYFSMIEWAHVFHKRYIPPYVPPINPLDETDTQNFDEAFLDMQPTVANGAEDGAENEPEAEGANAGEADAKVTGEVGQDAKQVSNENTELGDNRSLFDGYSFRGRRDSESVKSSILSSSSNPEPESVKGQEESEDEETAARAAVAALARLESEANAEEAASSPSANSMSTRPTSATLSGEGTSNATSDSDEQGGTPATKARSTLSAVGVPANEVIEETDDEDEDWDLVDAAPGTLQSEVNGGKGANLFARGVVDTYRLLRRQESSRIPPSPSQTSSRGFSRLSKRGPSSRRNISKASEGNLTSVSAASVDSNTRSGGDRSAAEDEPSGSEPTPSGLPGLAEAREKQAGSPSLASSDDHASQERRKRFKKRFTTFFDPPSVR